MTFQARVNCSDTFPVAKGDMWVVKGISGCSDERWTVDFVTNSTEKKGRMFVATVEHI